MTSTTINRRAASTIPTAGAIALLRAAVDNLDLPAAIITRSIPG